MYRRPSLDDGRDRQLSQPVGDMYLPGSHVVPPQQQPQQTDSISASKPIIQQSKTSVLRQYRKPDFSQDVKPSTTNLPAQYQAPKATEDFCTDYNKLTQPNYVTNPTNDQITHQYYSSLNKSYATENKMVCPQYYGSYNTQVLTTSPKIVQNTYWSQNDDDVHKNYLLQNKPNNVQYNWQPQKAPALDGCYYQEKTQTDHTRNSPQNFTMRNYPATSPFTNQNMFIDSQNKTYPRYPCNVPQKPDPKYRQPYPILEKRLINNQDNYDLSYSRQIMPPRTSPSTSRIIPPNYLSPNQQIISANYQKRPTTNWTLPVEYSNNPYLNRISQVDPAMAQNIINMHTAAAQYESNEMKDQIFFNHVKFTSYKNKLHYPELSTESNKTQPMPNYNYNQHIVENPNYAVKAKIQYPYNFPQDPQQSVYRSINYPRPAKPPETPPRNISPRRTFTENMTTYEIPHSLIHQQNEYYRRDVPHYDPYQQRAQNIIRNYPAPVPRMPTYQKYPITQKPEEAYYQKPETYQYSLQSIPEEVKSSKSCDMPKLNLKQYLECWKENEELISNLPDIVLSNNLNERNYESSSTSDNSNDKACYEDETTRPPPVLYVYEKQVLDPEMVSKYKHLMQIDHLPDNIIDKDCISTSELEGALNLSMNRNTGDVANSLPILDEFIQSNKAAANVITNQTVVENKNYESQNNYNVSQEKNFQSAIIQDKNYQSVIVPNLQKVEIDKEINSFVQKVENEKEDTDSFLDLTLSPVQNQKENIDMLSEYVNSNTSYARDERLEKNGFPLVDDFVMKAPIVPIEKDYNVTKANLCTPKAINDEFQVESFIGVSENVKEFSAEHSIAFLDEKSVPSVDFEAPKMIESHADDENIDCKAIFTVPVQTSNSNQPLEIIDETTFKKGSNDHEESDITNQSEVINRLETNKESQIENIQESEIITGLETSKESESKLIQEITEQPEIFQIVEEPKVIQPSKIIEGPRPVETSNAIELLKPQFIKEPGEIIQNTNDNENFQKVVHDVEISLKNLDSTEEIENIEKQIRYKDNNYESPKNFCVQTCDNSENIEEEIKITNESISMSVRSENEESIDDIINNSRDVKKVSSLSENHNVANEIKNISDEQRVQHDENSKEISTFNTNNSIEPVESISKIEDSSREIIENLSVKDDESEDLSEEHFVNEQIETISVDDSFISKDLQDIEPKHEDLIVTSSESCTDSSNETDVQDSCIRLENSSTDEASETENDAFQHSDNVDCIKQENASCNEEKTKENNSTEQLEMISENRMEFSLIKEEMIKFLENERYFLCSEIDWKQETLNHNNNKTQTTKIDSNEIKNALRNEQQDIERTNDKHMRDLKSINNVPSEIENTNVTQSVTKIIKPLKIVIKKEKYLENIIRNLEVKCKENLKNQSEFTNSEKYSIKTESDIKISNEFVEDTIKMNNKWENALKLNNSFKDEEEFNIKQVSEFENIDNTIECNNSTLQDDITTTETLQTLPVFSESIESKSKDIESPSEDIESPSENIEMNISKSIEDDRISSKDGSVCLENFENPSEYDIITNILPDDIETVILSESIENNNNNTSSENNIWSENVSKNNITIENIQTDISSENNKTNNISLENHVCSEDNDTDIYDSALPSIPLSQNKKISKTDNYRKKKNKLNRVSLKKKKRTNLKYSKKLKTIRLKRVTEKIKRKRNNYKKRYQLFMAKKYQSESIQENELFKNEENLKYINPENPENDDRFNSCQIYNNSIEPNFYDSDSREFIFKESSFRSNLQESIDLRNFTESISSESCPTNSRKLNPVKRNLSDEIPLLIPKRRSVDYHLDNIPCSTYLFSEDEPSLTDGMLTTLLSRRKPTERKTQVIPVDEIERSVQEAIKKNTIESNKKFAKEIVDEIVTATLKRSGQKSITNYEQFRNDNKFQTLERNKKCEINETVSKLNNLVNSWDEEMKKLSEENFERLLLKNCSTPKLPEDGRLKDEVIFQFEQDIQKDADNLTNEIFDDQTTSSVLELEINRNIPGENRAILSSREEIEPATDEIIIPSDLVENNFDIDESSEIAINITSDEKIISSSRSILKITLSDSDLESVSSDSIPKTISDTLSELLVPTMIQEISFETIQEISELNDDLSEPIILSTNESDIISNNLQSDLFSNDLNFDSITILSDSNPMESELQLIQSDDCKTKEEYFDASDILEISDLDIGGVETVETTEEELSGIIIDDEEVGEDKEHKSVNGECENHVNGEKGQGNDEPNEEINCKVSEEIERGDGQFENGNSGNDCKVDDKSCNGSKNKYNIRDNYNKFDEINSSNKRTLSDKHKRRKSIPDDAHNQSEHKKLKRNTSCDEYKKRKRSKSENNKYKSNESNHKKFKRIKYSSETEDESNENQTVTIKYNSSSESEDGKKLKTKQNSLQNEIKVSSNCTEKQSEECRVKKISLDLYRKRMENGKPIQTKNLPTMNPLTFLTVAEKDNWMELNPRDPRLQQINHRKTDMEKQILKDAKERMERDREIMREGRNVNEKSKMTILRNNVQVSNTDKNNLLVNHRENNVPVNNIEINSNMMCSLRGNEENLSHAFNIDRQSKETEIEIIKYVKQQIVEDESKKERNDEDKKKKSIKEKDKQRNNDQVKMEKIKVDDQLKKPKINNFINSVEDNSKSIKNNLVDDKKAENLMTKRKDDKEMKSKNDSVCNCKDKQKNSSHKHNDSTQKIKESLQKYINSFPIQKNQLLHPVIADKKFKQIEAPQTITPAKRNTSQRSCKITQFSQNQKQSESLQILKDHHCTVEHTKNLEKRTETGKNLHVSMEMLPMRSEKYKNQKDIKDDSKKPKKCDDESTKHRRREEKRKKSHGTDLQNDNSFRKEKSSDELIYKRFIEASTSYNTCAERKHSVESQLDYKGRKHKKCDQVEFKEFEHLVTLEENRKKDDEEQRKVEKLIILKKYIKSEEEKFAKSSHKTRYHSKDDDGQKCIKSSDKSKHHSKPKNDNVTKDHDDVSRRKKRKRFRNLYGSEDEDHEDDSKSMKVQISLRALQQEPNVLIKKYDNNDDDDDDDDDNKIPKVIIKKNGSSYSIAMMKDAKLCFWKPSVILTRVPKNDNIPYDYYC